MTGSNTYSTAYCIQTRHTRGAARTRCVLKEQHLHEDQAIADGEAIGETLNGFSWVQSRALKRLTAVFVALAAAVGKAIGETHNDFTWAAGQLADIIARAIRGAVGKTSTVTST